MQEFIKINREDTVAVASEPLSKGSTVTADQNTAVLREDIPQGHESVVYRMPEGASVIKYGRRIGFASRQIRPRDWVYIHNVSTALGDMLEYQYEPRIKGLPKASPSSFTGYKRGDGECGMRNELWILPTVGCVDSTIRAVEQKTKRHFPLESVGDIMAFVHPYGCSQMGEDQENARKVLADITHHPNTGGVLILGLGCEDCNIPVLTDYIGEYGPERVKSLQCQDCEDEVEVAMELLGQLYKKAFGDIGVECDASELAIGMKCGGFDRLPGVAANPVVGAFFDILISKGGTTIPTEVPEMFGAKTVLMNRYRDEETFHRTVKLINGFKEYFTSYNQTIYESPSPDNKKGDISAPEDKSSGYTQKSDSLPVCGVLGYGERVKERGLNLLSAPSSDLVATTALAVSGAQIVPFTTGRGTPFITLVPIMEISSDSRLTGCKTGWTDFNIGEMVETEAKDQVATELFQYVLRMVSGKKVKPEETGFHGLAIFKQEVTLQKDRAN